MMNTKLWKPFLISTVSVFLMVIMQFILRPYSSTLINPQLKIESFDKILPKLEQKANNFQLKKPRLQLPPAYAVEEYQLASAFAVVDADSGQVLLEKNLSDKLPIASLTKLMTAIVILDLTQPEDKFTVSEEAASIQPTKMGLIPQQKWGRDELLNALMLTSANDVAQVLKETIDQKYGSSTFIKAMNAKARFLGLKNSQFDNPQGFDGKFNFSSAEDLTILANYGLQNYPVLKEIVAKDYQFYPASAEHKQADLYNWNGLLRVYPGVLGVKIGNTGKAGYTTLVLSEREDKKVLVVLLGAPGVLERDLWAAQLLDLGFNKLSGLPPINLTINELKQKYASWKYFN